MVRRVESCFTFIPENDTAFFHLQHDRQIVADDDSFIGKSRLRKKV
jgi:hypothetical protein